MRRNLNQRHESFIAELPNEGVVACLLGSLSHVASPLYTRMYLYWNVVFTGSDTVTTMIIRDNAFEIPVRSLPLHVG